jgi:SpoVK/Ycf46/Vps4 family AAA+-type ATPase
MSASEELERLAAKYATEAVQQDRKGSKDQAITKYERAAEILAKLSTLYPDAPQNRVYSEHLKSYQRRVKELRDNHPLDQPTDGISYGRTEKRDQLILNKKPNVTWDMIAGLEDAKKAIEEAAIFPVKRPDLFPLGWPRGILFFGPPGCGKTLLAAAIATEIDATFYCVDSASVMSKWLGESEKNVANLFQNARKSAEEGHPAIIFLDEIDSLVGKRVEEVGGEVRTRNQFLKEMDGITDKNAKLHVYVIGATNKPWILDDPFIRRFQKRIYVSLPDFKARLAMLTIQTKELKLANDVDLNELATRTEGYTGSDIRDIVQSAQIDVVRELFENTDPDDRESVPREITMLDFERTLEKRKPSVSPQIAQNYMRWAEGYKAL